MSLTLDIQWKLQACLKLFIYPIFVGWFCKPVNMSVVKLYLKNCRGIVLVPPISDHFFCLSSGIPLEVINLCLLWDARPSTKSIKLTKRKGTVPEYLLNLRKCSSLTIFKEINFLRNTEFCLLTIASVIISLFVFQSCWEMISYWQAHFIYCCQFWVLLGKF